MTFFEQVHKIRITGKLFLISKIGKIIRSINIRHVEIGKYVSGIREVATGAWSTPQIICFLPKAMLRD